MNEARAAGGRRRRGLCSGAVGRRRSPDKGRNADGEACRFLPPAAAVRDCRRQSRWRSRGSRGSTPRCHRQSVRSTAWQGRHRHPRFSPPEAVRRALPASHSACRTRAVRPAGEPRPCRRIPRRTHRLHQFGSGHRPRPRYAQLSVILRHRPHPEPAAAHPQRQQQAGDHEADRRPARRPCRGRG